MGRVVRVCRGQSCAWLVCVVKCCLRLCYGRVRYPAHCFLRMCCKFIRSWAQDQDIFLGGGAIVLWKALLGCRGFTGWLRPCLSPSGVWRDGLSGLFVWLAFCFWRMRLEPLVHIEFIECHSPGPCCECVSENRVVGEMFRGEGVFRLGHRERFFRQRVLFFGLRFWGIALVSRGSDRTFARFFCGWSGR